LRWWSWPLTLTQSQWPAFCQPAAPHRHQLNWEIFTEAQKPMFFFYFNSNHNKLPILDRQELQTNHDHHIRGVSNEHHQLVLFKPHQALLCHDHAPETWNSPSLSPHSASLIFNLIFCQLIPSVEPTTPSTPQQPSCSVGLSFLPEAERPRR
jgi:hypothetical protein